MISTTARYALRSVVYLASGNQSFVKRSEIAEATMVPSDYLLKVLNELDAAGIVESRRGPGGGYRLTKPANEITTLDVVQTVETIPRIKKCPLGIAGHTKLCPLHQLLDDASRKVEEAFASTSIHDLVPQGKKTKSCKFPAINQNIS